MNKTVYLQIIKRQPNVLVSYAEMRNKCGEIDVPRCEEMQLLKAGNCLGLND